MRRTSPEAKKARKAAWYQKNKPIIQEKRKARERTPEGRLKIRMREKRRLYGITEQRFYEMLKGQAGSCAICKTASWGEHGPHVDHDHKSGKVRGLLCHRCNLVLGFSNDDPAILQAAIGYLKTKGK